jgi:hypothetical protein
MCLVIMTVEIWIFQGNIINGYKLFKYRTCSCYIEFAQCFKQRVKIDSYTSYSNLNYVIRAAHASLQN